MHKELKDENYSSFLRSTHTHICVYVLDHFKGLRSGFCIIFNGKNVPFLAQQKGIYTNENIFLDRACS